VTGRRGTHRQPRQASDGLNSQATKRRTWQRSQPTSQQPIDRSPAVRVTRRRPDLPAKVTPSVSLDQPHWEGGRGATRPETNATAGTVSSPAAAIGTTTEAPDTAPTTPIHRTKDTARSVAKLESARPPSPNATNLASLTPKVQGRGGGARRLAISRPGGSTLGASNKQRSHQSSQHASQHYITPHSHHSLAARGPAGAALPAASARETPVSLTGRTVASRSVAPSPAWGD
jgi:hypothetical protein